MTARSRQSTLEDAGQPPAPAHTAAELARVVGLLERMGARLVAVGHGRDRRSIATATAFVASWTAAGGEIATTVDWPDRAASSWLRQARRLVRERPDAWVIVDSARGWAPVAERLLEDGDRDPARAVGFDAVGQPDLPRLAGGAAVEGMHGATRSGGLWHIHAGRLVRHVPTARRPGADRRPPVEIAPGAIHVPDHLTVDEQAALVRACRDWARGPVPIRHTKLPRGGTMSVQTVCLGWHWLPYRYSRTADDVNGAPVAPLPGWLVDLGRCALAAAHGDAHVAGDYAPDAALINFYDGAARLGMHQDKDERSGAPVVSLSPATGLSSGRLNVTLRVTGLGA